MMHRALKLTKIEKNVEKKFCRDNSLPMYFNIKGETLLFHRLLRFGNSYLHIHGFRLYSVNTCTRSPLWKNSSSLKKWIDFFLLNQEVHTNIAS